MQTPGIHNPEPAPGVAGKTPALAYYRKLLSGSDSGVGHDSWIVDKPARLFQLAQLLAGRRSRPMDELADHFGVSRRTVYRDIADLSRRNIPVTRDEHGYRLLNGATIRPLALTAEEHAALKLVLANPAIRQTPDLARDLEMVEVKLDAATASTEDTSGALTLAGPERSGRVASGLASTLRRAAKDGTPVSILYRSLAGGRRTWRGVDPYAVFHREGTWYMAGRCHVHDEPRTFRLDRIAEVKLLESRFVRPPFNVDEFLQHTWAVYRGREMHHIVIHFDQAVAPLLEQATHHPEEHVERRPDGSLRYTVQLSHLEEIARWILGFGGLARAVEPPALVELVAGMAGRVHARHRAATD